MTGVRKRIRLRRTDREERKARKAVQRKLRREQTQKSAKYIQLQAKYKAKREAQRAFMVSCYSLYSTTINIDLKIEGTESTQEARATGNEESREGSKERGGEILAKHDLAVLE
jgi:hypothetical protein